MEDVNTDFCIECECKHPTGKLGLFTIKETLKLASKVKILLFFCTECECKVNYFFKIGVVCCCNAQGSNGNNCVANGICNCRANIVGRKCDSCAGGHFNFPMCQGKNHY